MQKIFTFYLIAGVKLALVLPIFLLLGISHADPRPFFGRSCPLLSASVLQSPTLQDQIEVARQCPDLFLHDYLATFHLHPLEGGITVGLVGDSVPAGAVISPLLQASKTSILRKSFCRFFIEYPILYFLDNSLLNSGTERFNFGQDDPLFAFGQIISRILNVGHHNIMNVAVDGAKVESMPEQFSRLTSSMQQRTGKLRLPRLVLVSYTANNMCSTDVFGQYRQYGSQFFEDYYERELMSSYEKILNMTNQLQNQDEPTRILVLANLDVMNVLENPSVLDRQVDLDWESVTCKSFRKPYAPTDSFLLSKLFGMCRSILEVSIAEDGRENREILRQIHASYLRAHQKAILNVRDRFLKQNITIEFLPQTASIDFNQKDIGNDCFHPNFFGQLKIATTVLSSQLEFFKNLYNLQK